MGEDLMSDSEAHCEERIQMRCIDLGYINLPKLHATEEAIAKSGISTFMLWVARPSTVNLGYFQSAEKEVDLKEAQRLGLGITRRPSGGGAVLFDDKQLYYSIVAGLDSDVLPKGARACFLKAAEGLVNALEEFGLKGEFKGKNDVVVNGKKISGNAQTSRWGAKVQHGTLLLDFDIETAARVLKIPAEKIEDKGIKAKDMHGMIEERVTTLKKELSGDTDTVEVKEALKRGFSKALNVKLVDGSITDSEKEMRDESIPKYESPEWIYRR
jgi:lipoate-protein ligase A